MNLLKVSFAILGFMVLQTFIVPADAQPVVVFSSDRFAEFLELFPEAELPYAVSFEELESYDEKSGSYEHQRLISEFFPKYKYVKFSRSGPPVITPIRSFKKDDLIAIVYISKQRFSSNFSDLICSTFNSKGEFLNSISLGHSTYQNVATSSIDKNGIIEKVTFEKIWKKDVREHGTHENEVVRRKKSNVEFFQIEKGGSFKELKEYKTTARASLD